MVYLFHLILKLKAELKSQLKVETRMNNHVTSKQRTYLLIVMISVLYECFLQLGFYNMAFVFTNGIV